MGLVLAKGEDGGGLVLVFLVWDGPSLVIPVFLSDSGYPCFFIYENHYVSVSQGHRVIILLFTSFFFVWLDTWMGK